MVPRGTSSSADAYLSPVLKNYLSSFLAGFEEGARVEFMTSDGSLVDLDSFSGLKSILSGPAGGVVGHAWTSWDESEHRLFLYDSRRVAVTREG
jgi:5-oxoprolinase (ATP-hydrolysing)